MKRMIVLVLCICALGTGGCAYNSRNLFRLSGRSMNFNYGLISVTGVNKIILLRETNMGNSEAKYNLKSINEYMCSVDSERLVADSETPTAEATP